jgi:hypothetical protein
MKPDNEKRVEVAALISKIHRVSFCGHPPTAPVHDGRDKNMVFVFQKIIQMRPTGNR